VPLACHREAVKTFPLDKNQNCLERFSKEKLNYPMERNTANKAIRSLLLLVPLLVLAAGCHREQVQVYQVSQDQDQSSQPAVASTTNSTDSGLPPGHPDISSPDNSSMQSMPAGMVPPDTSAGPLTWTTPAGWSQVPPSEMRVASFKISGTDGKQADVSVIPLGGMAGGDFANVNRWRGQVGLPPATDDELQSSAENVQAGGQPAALYDLASANFAAGKTDRIIGVIQHRDGTAWFFKMTGDADLVEQQKPVFIDFLKTLVFGSQQTQEQQPPAPALGDMSASAASGPVSHDGQPGWQVPPGWKQVDGGSFLVAKFMLAGDGGATAAVNVSTSAGDGGGLAANVNRWRGQIGLPSEDEISTVAFVVPGGQAQLVDFSGTNAQTGQPAEIVAVVVTLPDRTWFYKLMGDPKLVAAQKDTFTAFVKSVQY
jgi:hypothetical protein